MTAAHPRHPGLKSWAALLIALCLVPALPALAQTAAAPSAGASAAAPAAPEAAAAAKPVEAAASSVPAAEAPPPPPPSCTALTARAMAADLRATTAQTLNRDLEVQIKQLDEALALWRAAVDRCEERAKERAARHLADGQRQRAALNERHEAGAACENAHRDAASLQDLARQAFGERRWSDAGTLYRKAETMWELAAEQCSGKQQQTAQQRRLQSEIDGHNAEFCAPQFDRAREHTQKFRNSAAGLAVADKQRVSMEAETLWRQAVSQCKGNAQELAQNNAQALARERGTPWVSTLPAGMTAPAATAAASTATTPGAKPAASAGTATTQAAQPTAKPTAAAGKGAAAATAATAATASAGAAASEGPGLLSGIGSALGNLASAATKPVEAPPAAVEKPSELDIRVGDTRFKGLFVREEGQVVTGTGRVEWANGDVYEGALLRGKRQGQGTLQWANGQRYQGEWQDDRPTGRGQLRFANGNQFDGTVINGVPEGEGEMLFASGDRYKGQLRAGLPHGKGRYQWANGQVFEGDWVADKPQGQGQMRFANGQLYDGQIDAGQPHGKGRMRYGEAGVYEGDFVRGVAEGQGIYRWPGGESYEGAWRAGLKHGRGVYRWATGDRWEGEYLNDQQTDKGELIRKSEGQTK